MRQSRLIQSAAGQERPRLPIHVLVNMGVHGEPLEAVCGELIATFMGYREWSGEATEANCEACLARIAEDPSRAIQQLWARPPRPGTLFGPPAATPDGVEPHG